MPMDSFHLSVDDGVCHQTSMSFLLLCITIFADDICSHQMFHSEESFINLLKAFGTLLDLIETANLELNLAKTTVTLRMKGRLGRGNSKEDLFYAPKMEHF